MFLDETRMVVKKARTRRAAEDAFFDEGTSTPPWRIRLKAHVDLGDQTAEFIPFEVIRTATLTYFYLF